MVHSRARRYERAFKVAALERMAAGENVSALSRELGIRLRLHFPAVARPQPRPGPRPARLRRPPRGGPPARPSWHRYVAPRARARARGGRGRAQRLLCHPRRARRRARPGRARGPVRNRIRFFCRAALLIVDGIGYLPGPTGGNYFGASEENSVGIDTSSRSTTGGACIRRLPPRRQRCSKRSRRRQQPLSLIPCLSLRVQFGTQTGRVAKLVEIGWRRHRGTWWDGSGGEVKVGG